MTISAQGKLELSFWFEVEADCNLECKFCYNHWKSFQTKKPDRLNTDSIINLLEKLFSQCDCKHFVFSGGEPFLRKDIFSILDFVNHHKIPFSIITNGLLVNRDALNTIASYKHLTGIVLPFHSHDERRHNYISGKDNWKKIISLLLTFQEEGIAVTPVFVCTKVNMDDINQVIELCYMMKLSNIIFNRFIHGGAGLRYLDELSLNDDELLNVMISLSEATTKYNINVKFGTPIPKTVQSRLALPCRLDFTSCPVNPEQRRFTIDASGNLKMCNHTHLVIGSLKDESIGELMSKHRKLSAGIISQNGDCIAEPGWPLSHRNI
jgi:MoaA/NifB/PqqE/SkfB family radical SAM enzyme